MDTTTTTIAIAAGTAAAAPTAPTMAIGPIMTGSSSRGISRDEPLLNHQSPTANHNATIEGHRETTRAQQQQEQEQQCCCYSFWMESVWPGSGLLGESYVLFSIGTLKPIWELLFPDCFHGNACSATVVHALTYSAVLGVMTGMIWLGYAANGWGRRVGSIVTASLMAAGAVGLTAISVVLAESDNPNILFRCMSACLFVFGVGVGGEYPLSAATASERAMGELQRRIQLEHLEQQQKQLPVELLVVLHEEHKDRRAEDGNHQNAHGKVSTVSGSDVDLGEPHKNNKKMKPNSHHLTSSFQYSSSNHRRGQKVQMVFSMQGMGILLNSIVMTTLLIMSGQGQQRVTGSGGDDDNNLGRIDTAALMRIWQTTYGIGAIMLLTVWIGRVVYLRESTVWQNDRDRREQQQKRVLSCNNDTNNNSRSDEAGSAEITTTPATIEASAGHSGKGSSQSAVPAGEPPPLPDMAMAVSLVSTISSLSVPSVLIDDDDSVWLQPVPSTDHNGDDRLLTQHELFLRNYGVRLFGASLCWLLWDVAFYGNKLFQSQFLLALTGEETTLLEFAIAATLNSAVALAGYFGAAVLLDQPTIGRRRLQQYGFLLTGLLFVACGFLYHHLSSGSLIALYLGSSFFGQLGPNATTFLIPAEIFPTEVRTMCHGIAAAAGKFGALLAAIAFHYVETELDMFLLSGYASFVACIVTFWTIPETIGLDLYELDRKWRMTVDGHKGDYVGPANHPRYLSYYERNNIRMQQQQQQHHDLGIHFHALD